MSLTSSNSNRNTTKLRLVFLGDQGVGKTSIIDRYTTNQYDDNHNVPTFSQRTPLASISMLKISAGTDKTTDYKCGILLVNNDIEV